MKDRKKKKRKRGRGRERKESGKEGRERGKEGRKKLAGQWKRLEELCNRRHISAELGHIIMKIMLEYYLNMRRKCQYQM